MAVKDQSRPEWQEVVAESKPQPPGTADQGDPDGRFR